MKKKHAEEHENLERWLVSYADFITLLFAFFTVMYALSVSDKTKYRQALENIQRSFLSAGGIFPLKGTPMSPYENPTDQGAEAPPSPADIGKMPRSGAETPDRDLTEQVRSLFKDTTGLGAPSGQVEVVRSEDGYRIRIGEQMLFNAGSDKLRREYVPFLFEMGKRLKNLNLPIQIEGHSDATSATKRANWHLSVSRAFNVMQFLVEGPEFPQDRISLAGFGDSRPLASNETPEGRARNRRVEIVVLAPNHEIKDLGW